VLTQFNEREVGEWHTADANKPFARGVDAGQ
jgi:hypothetical protein